MLSLPATDLYLLFLGALSVAAQNLLTLLPDDDKRSSLAPCLQPGVETCTQVLPGKYSAPYL